MIDLIAFVMIRLGVIGVALALVGLIGFLLKLEDPKAMDWRDSSF